MGDDNALRKVENVSVIKKPGYRIKYQSYLDSGFDKSFVCGATTVIPIVPEGNRLNNLEIHCDESRNFIINYLDPILNRDN